MKNCIRCNLAGFALNRNGFCSSCVKLNQKEQKAAWRAANKDKVQAQNLRTQSKFREKIAANTKEWRLKNPDYLKTWNEEKPDKNKEYQKKHREQKNKQL